MRILKIEVSFDIRGCELHAKFSCSECEDWDKKIKDEVHHLKKFRERVRDLASFHAWQKHDVTDTDEYDIVLDIKE